VVGAARDLAKARAALAGANVALAELELDSLASVRRFARWFDSTYPALHVLVNNAGVMACPFGRTQDGFERQLGTNHLGHFLLTGLLVPRLVAGAPARVVSVSSAPPRRGRRPRRSVLRARRAQPVGGAAARSRRTCSSRSARPPARAARVRAMHHRWSSRRSSAASPDDRR
jgi:NAD(P)-dependent dehydrogenase (short-subunit alcohol dehydrogenase family)